LVAGNRSPDVAVRRRTRLPGGAGDGVRRRAARGIDQLRRGHPVPLPGPTSRAQHVTTVDLGSIGGAASRALSVVRSRGRVRSVWRRPTVVVSIVTLVVLFAAAVLAPVLPLPDPIHEDVVHKLAPPSWAPGGLEGHLLGTDQLGRDVFSRLVYGAR